MKTLLAVTAFLMIGAALAQTPTPTPVYPINADLVINATEYAEFERTVLEQCNNEDFKQISAFIFRSAIEGAVPSGTGTVSITQAQFNRWFNPADNGSYLCQAHWSLTNSALKRRRLPEPITLQRAVEMAPTKINNETKRARFLALIASVSVPVEDW